LPREVDCVVLRAFTSVLNLIEEKWRLALTRRDAAT